MYPVRRPFTRLLVATMATMIASATIAIPTASASVINSSLSNVRDGFRGRDLTHSTNTPVQAGFIGCSSNAPAANSKFNIELKENISWKPDRSVGTRDAKQCFYQPWRVGWGNPSKGKYYMVVRSHAWQSTSAKNFNMYF